MTTGTLRFGIIGCGRIHRNHAQAARAVDGVELVGVADLDEATLDAAAREWVVPGYRDFRELLEHVDLVSICLPHHLHAPVSAAAAEAGVHVLMEKPLATSLEESDEIIDACERAGVKLGVVYQHRFNENTLQLRRLLQSGRLGRPILGSALFQYFKATTDTKYFAGSGWRGTWERDGGGVLNAHAVHTIDLVTWLLGPDVAEVKGLIGTLTHDIEVEDTGVALLRFENGALATVAGSMSVGVKFDTRIVISGTEGVATLTDSRRLDVEYLNGSKETHVYEDNLADPAFQTNLAYGRGHIAQLADFADAIREDRAPMCDGRDARRVLDVVKRIYADARPQVTAGT
jgi:UDP-N-acetyl-2-amino-2-deoxyglucuronate dehydrogenase